jgi:hypothetical protein
MVNTLPQALDYLRMGYAVIPCGENKRPYIDSWKPYQTERPTETRIKEWWDTWPAANVAIITGEVSGLTVIDVDGDTGIASIRDNEIKLPATKHIKTPRGHHLYYQFNPQFHTGAGFLPGLDVRSNGGYVVAPPSEIGGVPYLVWRDRPVVQLTITNEQFQAKHRTKDQPPQETSPGWVSEALANGAPETKRNSTAIRLAGYFHSRNIPDDIIMATLLEFGRKCTPPMDERELWTVVRSAARYPTKPETIRIENPPEMTVLGDTYRFRWDQYSLIALLEQIHEDKEGVHTEISLLSDKDGQQKYIYGPIRYNLTASVQRSGITKHLKDYAALDADKMLQDLSRMAIMEQRKGEEPVYLADIVAPKQPEWAIDKLILHGHPNILFGMGGTAKSYLALAMMLTLQAGRDIGFGFKPSRAMRGLYLDWEFEGGDHHQRMAWLCRNDFESAGLGVMYLRCTGSLYQSIAKIKKIIMEHEIDFIVVDSVAIACGGEPEEAQNALRFFDAIRTLKVTSLCIAHTTKEDSKGMPFGSVFFHNACRNSWEIFKDQDEGQAGLHVMLKHRKSNVGPLQTSIGVSLKFGTQTCDILVTDTPDRQSPVFAPRLTNREKLIGFLEAHGPSSPANIVREGLVTDQNLRQVLSRDKVLVTPTFVVTSDGYNIVSIGLATDSKGTT